MANERVRRVQELRRSNAARPIPSKTRYERMTAAELKELRDCYDNASLADQMDDGEWEY
jgi:hypothetical protein